MRKLFCVLLSILIALCFLTSCSDTQQESDKLSIVTTIFPLYDFARQITGGSAEVTMLLQPGMESHSYEPTPQDIIKIQKCDAFFYIGGESDEWIEDVMSSLDTDKLEIIPLIEHVELFEEKLSEGMESEDAHEHSDEHEYDEHIWTSPKNAITIVNKMTDVICSVDNDNTDKYKNNSSALISDIEAIDKDIQQIVDSAVRKTLVFGDRFPFRYLTEQYGLDYYAAFPGCSSQTEPSASTVAFLIDTVKKNNIPVVFYTEFSDMKMAETICESTGAKKALLHSCHNVTKDDFNNGVTYVELMKKNVGALREALN